VACGGGTGGRNNGGVDVHVPTGRRRVPLGVLAGILVIAGGAALIGFLVSRTTGTDLARVSAAVVAVSAEVRGGATTTGSGMIITPAGEVLTNYHVVNGAQRVSVAVPHLGARSAAVVGIDPRDDVAVLQLENASGLPTVSISDSTPARVGDRVTVVGAAAAGGDTPVTVQGTVASLGQSVTSADPNGRNTETLGGLIQVGAAVRSSDCGGPLVNSAGQVVGMDAAGADRVRQNSVDPNTGFAIPITTVMAIARDIGSGAANPNVLRGQSVVLGVNVTASVMPLGAAVVAVEPDSPAQAAGIVAMDVIVGLGGTRVDSVATLVSAIQRHRAGDRVLVAWVDLSAREHSATVQLAAGLAS
jgi:S1-C subfamily serine protease